MRTERIIMGLILITFAIYLLTKSHIVATIYGVAIILIGLYLIIFAKQEQKIEQRKDLKPNKPK